MPIALLIAAAAAMLPIPDGAALTDAIAARDKAVFELLFTSCDPVAMAGYIAPDFEMYHDKGGVVARNRADFIADYAKSCEAKKAPDAWRSRRELVPASLNVHPVPGYGAIEDGEHIFYERRGDGPERKAGTARFTQLWQLTPAGWQLSRVFSYAHKAAE
ncbi:MAG: nuclear transport factor 2 family protein [Polymorphobacter sp.]